LTTKVILTAADEDTAIAVDVVPGQASDAPLLAPMLDATAARVPVVDEVVADKGFDGDPQRHACLDRDVFPNIPNKRNRVEPWAFDRAAYRGRNRVERLIGKAKQFRRFATRYEKLRSMYLGVVHLVLGFIRLRRLATVNTP
jgi:transposase